MLLSAAAVPWWRPERFGVPLPMCGHVSGDPTCEREGQVEAEPACQGSPSQQLVPGALVEVGAVVHDQGREHRADSKAGLHLLVPLTLMTETSPDSRRWRRAEASMLDR